MNDTDPLEGLSEAQRKSVEGAMRTIEAEHGFQAKLKPYFERLSRGVPIERDDDSEQFVQGLAQAVEDQLPNLGSSLLTMGRRLTLASPDDRSLDIGVALEALSETTKTVAQLIALRHAISLSWES